MASTEGGAAGDPLDPLDGLLFFHRSIRVALDALDALAAVARIGATEQVRAHALLDFFKGPMRWHDVDERQSVIVPLLQGEASERTVEILRAARREHEEIEALVDTLVVHLGDIARHGLLPDAALLTEAAARLRTVMEPHLRREEAELFPLARASFGEQDLARMRTEIQSRRRARERPA